jgi:hypothetical protein
VRPAAFRMCIHAHARTQPTQKTNRPANCPSPSLRASSPQHPKKKPLTRMRQAARRAVRLLSSPLPPCPPNHPRTIHQTSTKHSPGKPSAACRQCTAHPPPPAAAAKPAATAPIGATRQDRRITRCMVRRFMHDSVDATPRLPNCRFEIAPIRAAERLRRSRNPWRAARGRGRAALPTAPMAAPRAAASGLKDPPGPLQNAAHLRLQRAPVGGHGEPRDRDDVTGAQPAPAQEALAVLRGCGGQEAAAGQLRVRWSRARRSDPREGPTWRGAAPAGTAGLPRERQRNGVVRRVQAAWVRACGHAMFHEESQPRTQTETLNPKPNKQKPERNNNRYPVTPGHPQSLTLNPQC